MINDEFIRSQREMLQRLGDRLANEMKFSNAFIDKSKRPEVEKKWMLSVNSACTYSIVLIRSLMETMETFKKLTPEKLGLFVGKTAIISFLELINAFEQTMNNFIDENNDLKSLIQARIDKKNSIIEKNWKKDSNRKSRDFKANIINQWKNKIYEMAFIRDTLKSKDIINDLDHKILTFAWDIRNSMHKNFTALRDTNFSYPDIKTGNVYSFNFVKGQELYHPQDLVSFYIITEQIIFIMLKILQYFSTSK